MTLQRNCVLIRKRSAPAYANVWIACSLSRRKFFHRTIVCRLIYRSMPSGPKKPIEQMLEALAKARRAQFGVDPKMPNPMRVRLHEEIARTEATEDEKVESRGSWLTMFWPRVTVAAALATLIVLVPAIWWNRTHPLAESGDLALSDRTAGAPNELNPAVLSEDALAKAPAANATAPTVNLADNRQIKIEPDKEIAA